MFVNLLLSIISGCGFDFVVVGWLCVCVVL